MEIASHWRKFLLEWPSGIPQQGVVVTSFDEQVNFIDFMLSEHLVMFERRAPVPVQAEAPFDDGALFFVQLAHPVIDNILNRFLVRTP